MAISIVIISVITSLTYAFVVTESAPTSNRIPGFVPARILFSVRNNTTTPLQISSINIKNPPPVPCAAYTNAKPLASAFNDTIDPGKQQQFYVDTMSGGIDPALQGPCTYNVVTSAGTQTLTVDFAAVVGSGDPVDVQPRAMSFGSQYLGSSEDQHVFITNYTSGTLSSYRAQLFGSGFTFQGSACTAGSTFCMPKPILQNSYQELIVRCTPTSPGLSSGTLMVFGTGSGSAMMMMLGSNSLSCSAMFAPPQVHIVDDPVQIVTAVNTTGSASVMITNTGMGPEALVGLTLTGSSSFGFADAAHCTGQSCTYAPPIPLGTTTIYVTCKPTDTVPRNAQLLAQGSSSSDTSTVTCMGTTMSGPVMSVTPAMITITSQIPVGGMSGSNTVTIKNLGDLPLNSVQTSVTGVGLADWSVTNPCPSPCNIAPNALQNITVMFTPHTHGDRHATLHVSAANYSPPADVELYGTGAGAVLSLAPLDISFGTIPRNQVSQHDVLATNQGNAATFVMPSGVSPFSIGSDAVNGFNLAGGEMRTFKVGCGSNMAMSYDANLPVVAPMAYVGAMQSIHASCTVAPTDIRVTPTDYDYGEVFRGTAAVTKTIDISNPTTMNIDVTRVAITGTRPGLTLAGGFTGATTIMPGKSIPGLALTLNPTDETDLAGVNFEIDVQNTTLSFPVTGKVVTPHSYVTPYPNLDLGTACVGTQVRGTEMLINDGTATLLVDPPIMDMGFRTMFSSPGTYPTNLAPGGHANVQLLPSTSTSGPLHGRLTWHDSVPNDYVVDVDLTYVSDGPALSPRALAFGTIDVDTTSPEQTITLENCGLQPVAIKVLDVVTVRGRADAWVITPGNGYAKTLGTHDKLTITARFAPHRSGHFDAQLRLEVNSAMQTVALVGDANGGSGDHTSFYSCGGCTGQGAPVRGWPIVGAIVFVIARRRKKRA